MSVVDDAFKIATTGFDFKKAIDRHRGMYVRRRGEFLNKQNSSLQAPQLATQLKAELTAIQNYIAGKDALINDKETNPVKHLDLKKGAALVTWSIDGGKFGEPFFNGVLKEALTNRIERVAQIVWRAVAIHSDVLWKSPGPPPQLQQTALDELLDRRLVAIEQMHFTVNTAGFNRDMRPWKVQGPTGPWFDGYLMRAFEYPSVMPAGPFEPFLTQMEPDWHRSGNVVSFDPKNHVRVRVAPKAANAWRMNRDLTWINFHPSTSVTPAEIIEEMFTPRGDFWDRNWMFCDHVGSLVNIVALAVGLSRRNGNTTAFDEVMSRPDYVRLGPVIGDRHDRDRLLADDQDPYFENTDIPMDDLQVGDFVRFWNSRLYELLPPYAGAWGSEFSLVMSIDVDGSSGKVPRPLAGGPQVWLAGHGVHTQLYNAMAAEAASQNTSRLSAALRILSSETGDRKNDGGHVYVRWSPYEPLNNAWWAEIPKSTWHDIWEYSTQEEVLKGVPRSVATDAGGTGYHPPPDSDAVYFPLFEPAVDQTDPDGDSWRAYLRQRKANASFRLKSADLKPLAIDGRLAPGLFYHGSNGKISIVRPRVRI